MIRLGLLGCGNLARQAHLPAVARYEGAAFIAYADVNREAAEQCLREFGGSYAIAPAQAAGLCPP